MGERGGADIARWECQTGQHQDYFSDHRLRELCASEESAWGCWGAQGGEWEEGTSDTSSPSRRASWDLLTLPGEQAPVRSHEARRHAAKSHLPHQAGAGMGWVQVRSRSKPRHTLAGRGGDGVGAGAIQIKASPYARGTGRYEDQAPPRPARCPHSCSPLYVVELRSTL